MQNMDRMRELIHAINDADEAYYKKDDPIMTDLEYDQLYDELVTLEKESGIVLSSSPTQRVPGNVLESLTVVRHSRPMLSADKRKSVADIHSFLGGHQAVLSWKLDGLTLVLRYKDGKLLQAITRGDGLQGEDVTHAVRVMQNVPLAIPCTQPLEVRGEGVISWKEFHALNGSLDEPYAHPRNLAAGSVRKLNAEEVRERGLTFMAFDLISDNLGGKTKWETLRFMAQMGFTTVGYSMLAAGASEDAIHQAMDYYKPRDYAYPTDGLIFEFNDLDYGRSLGATGHHENRMIAFKWPDTRYETKFRHLEIATTRTGMISLTGVFDDVNIDGTTVNHAYLHNLDNFMKLALGSGDIISVYKANMIIPQIAENKTKSGNCSIPTVCPCCGNMLQVRRSSGGTRQLFCENEACPARLVRKFVHFCSKTRMEIKGLDEQTLTTFVQHGWVTNYGDLFELERHKGAILETPGFGEKSFARLQSAVDERRTCTLNQFIAALGIPEVGRHAGRILSRRFGGSWTSFEQAIRERFDFTQLEGFGQVMHDNIYNWYNDAGESRLWRPVLKHITFLKEENTMPDMQNNPFAGKTVVATGKLENYTQDGIQMKLLSLGARPASSVSKKTDYLIVGESAGSKLTKAQTLGIKTLTEQEFLQMLVDAEIEA